MRILITTFTYPPNKDGVAEACRSLAEGLVKLGWEVWVATSMAGNTDFSGLPRHEMNGVKMVHFNLLKVSRDRDKPWPGVEDCRDFVRQGNFDIVVNQCWEAQISMCLQPIRHETRARWVLISHGYGAHMYVWHRRLTMGIGFWFRGLLFTFRKLPQLIQFYDQLIFLSEREDFGRFFDHRLANLMQHPDIRIVANGIDLQQFEQSGGTFRESNGIGNAPMALCVANYSERKNQMLTVEAFRKANVPGSVLVCIGSDLNDYGKRVMESDRKLARSYPDCRVLFLEKLDREVTYSAFRACDVFLLTAKAETQPIVLIEAMAARKPWISTNTGCAAEMRGGLICHTKRALISEIRRVLCNHALSAELGTEGRRDAELRYDSLKNIRQFDELFKGLIAKTP